MSGQCEIVHMYDCSQCPHQTTSVFQLNHHIQRKHKHVYAAELFHAIVEPEQFSCICCGYKSYYQFELYEHCLQAHNPRTENGENELSFVEEPGKYSCDYCKFQSDSSIIYSISHHDLCVKTPPQRINGIDTMRTFEDVEVINILTCSHCSFQAQTKSTFKTHMFEHAADKDINWFKCNHCSYQARRKEQLNSHILKHATNEDINWFQCAKCSFRSRYKGSLKTHMLLHATEQEISWFQCIQCSHRSKSKYDLKMHYRLEHPSNEGFQCAKCSYRAQTRGNLKIHMLKHASSEDINWFKCCHCSYRAKQKTTLKIHMLQHASSQEIDWFKCNLCSYRAKLKTRLKNHMLKHELKHASSEKINWLFKCAQCTFLSKYEGNVKEHMLLHVRTRSKDNLRRHMLTHPLSDEITWFQCYYCSYRDIDLSKRHYCKV